MRNTLVVFGAGCLGGLVMCVAMWIFSQYGVTHLLGVKINGSIAPQWMYPRIVWGGLWGLLFLLPLMSGNILARSFVMSLLPTLVQLLVFYPNEGKGMGGLSLGLLTPFLVLFFYWIWALTTVLCLRLAR